MVTLVRKCMKIIFRVYTLCIKTEELLDAIIFVIYE